MAFGDDRLMQFDKTGNCSVYFSIILVSYKHDDFFADALNTVINQNYDKSRMELIIVCKSFGKPRDIIKETQFDFEVKLVIDDGFSQGSKYNSALQIARHEWIALLDDDDMWKPDKLLVLSDLILNNDELIYIHNLKRSINGQVHFSDIYFETNEKKENRDCRNTNKMKNNPINCMHNGSSITFKKQIVSKYKYQLSNMPGGIDFFLFALAKIYKGKLLCLDQELTYFRIQQKNYEFSSTQIIYNLTRQLNGYYIIDNIIQNDSKLRAFLHKQIISNQMKLSVLGNLKYSRIEAIMILKRMFQLKENVDKEFLIIGFLFGITLINGKFAKRIYELASTSQHFA